VRAAGGVRANQDLPARPNTVAMARELAQRLAQHPDVVGRGVRPGVPGVQQHRQGLASAGRAVVDERGVMAEPAL